MKTLKVGALGPCFTMLSSRTPLFIVSRTYIYITHVKVYNIVLGLDKLFVKFNTIIIHFDLIQKF